MRRCALLICLLTAAVATTRAETIALALSGGGARGFAHIGVLRALEEEQIQPDLIVGTSIGAVIGGLYVAGYSASELEAYAVSIDWSSVFLDQPARRNLFLSQKETNQRHILGLGFRGWSPEVPLALSQGQRLFDLLFDLVQKAPYRAISDFDDLRIPFRALATDLNSGRGVVFRGGDLAEAMRASVSMPLLIQPYQMDSLLLADGGLEENIPVATARREGGTFVIAVDVTASDEPSHDITQPWELVERVSTILQSERDSVSRSAADLVIRPRLSAYRSTDFTNIKAVIDSGYAAAKKWVAQIRAEADKRHAGVQIPVRPNCVSLTEFVNYLNASKDAEKPTAYQFCGISAFPDSQLTAVPAGRDGLTKLSLVRRMLVDEGFSAAYVEKLSQRDSVLECRWNEGVIQSVEVRGLSGARAKLLEREFPLRKGEKFSFRSARKGLNQIYGSSLYETVALATLPGDSGIQVVLRVVEQPFPQLRVGAGFSSERKGRGFLEFVHNHMAGLGARMRLLGKYGERDEELSGIFNLDRLPIRLPFDNLFQSSLNSELRGAWERKEDFSYDRNHRARGFYFFERYMAEAALGRAFRRWGQISYALRWESIDGGGIEQEPTATLGGLGVRTRIDTKDRNQFPTSGFEWRGHYLYFVQSGNGQRSFNQIGAFADVCLPVAKRTVCRVQGDYAWNDRILPLWAQFPLGGDESLIGLHEREMFGNSKFSLLAEIRYDLLSRWLADAFVSGIYTTGAVTGTSLTFPPSGTFLHGVGGSFGLATFLGPMKITAGELLKNRLGPGHMVVYVSLGHQF